MEEKKLGKKMQKNEEKIGEKKIGKKIWKKNK